MVDFMALRRRLSGALPPPIRRAGAGLLLDLKDLPARLADPVRWGDPWQTVHNVGGGDYRAAGRVLLATLVEQAGLRPDQRVLDIGCGAGRVAVPLADYLAPSGPGEARYVGFDVSRSAVASCRRRFRALRPDFAFVHVDIRNADYNAAGAVDPRAYVFPCADASIDLAFAFSVFTHMQRAEIAHYLAEAARVLKPGGRFAFSAYRIDDLARVALSEAKARMAFQPWRDDAWVTDPRHPERAIAHEAASLEALIAAAGLSPVRPPLHGEWAGTPDYTGWQDLLVLERSA